MAGAPVLTTLSSDVVEQAIDQQEWGRFRKDVVRADLPSGRVVAMVRKRPADRVPLGSVVLVHGFAQNRYSWHLSRRSFVNALADQGFDVWNLELTGHGRSREFGSGPARAFSDYVEDAASALPAINRAAAVDRSFLIGHSLGGAVCYGTAPRVAADVAGVVTLGGLFRFGSNPVTRGIGEWLARLAAVEPAIRRMGAGFLSRGVGSFISRFWEHADDLFWSFPMAGWVPGSTEPEVLQERLERGFDWTGINVFLTMMRWAKDGTPEAELGSHFEADWAALDLPLLVIAGDRDRLLPPMDARPAYDVSRSRDKCWKLMSPAREEVHWGHLDLVLGKHAPRYVWPYISSWLLERVTRP
jgi:pimeloyl-ACP methyl ester carboxylesterase